MPDVAFVALAAATPGAWLVFRLQRKRSVDRCFGIHLHGGREGNLRVHCPDFVAVTGYEVGGSVDVIVHARGMRTAEGKGLSREQREQALQRIREWGKARGTSIEVTD